MMLVILLAIVLVAATLIDSARYTAYRQRYYGVVNPPYVFRPILFWHGPSYGWYRRRWRQPPPPPPPRGPRGPGGGGFSGFSGPGGGSRGSGFPVDREAAASPVVPAAAASPPALSVEVASVAPGAEDFLVAAVEALRRPRRRFGRR